MKKDFKSELLAAFQTVLLTLGCKFRFVSAQFRESGACKTGIVGNRKRCLVDEHLETGLVLEAQEETGTRSLQTC